MSHEMKHVLKTAGLLLALGLSVVRVSTWAARADVRCARRGSALELSAHLGTAAVDVELRLPGGHSCTHGG
jgi:hypothetical protein